MPELGSCASTGRAWRLWAAQHSQKEAGPLGAQPLPRMLERAASKATGFTALDHPGAQADGHGGAGAHRGPIPKPKPEPKPKPHTKPKPNTKPNPKPEPEPEPNPNPNQVPDQTVAGDDIQGREDFVRQACGG